MQRIRGHSGPIGQVLVDMWWGRGGVNDSKRQLRLRTRTWDPHWASGMERETACGHDIRVCAWQGAGATRMSKVKKSKSGGRSQLGSKRTGEGLRVQVRIRVVCLRVCK